MEHLGGSGEEHLVRGEEHSGEDLGGLLHGGGHASSRRCSRGGRARRRRTRRAATTRARRGSEARARRARAACGGRRVRAPARAERTRRGAEASDARHARRSRWTCERSVRERRRADGVRSPARACGSARAVAGGSKRGAAAFARHPRERTPSGNFSDAASSLMAARALVSAATPPTARSFGTSRVASPRLASPRPRVRARVEQELASPTRATAPEQVANRRPTRLRVFRTSTSTRPSSSPVSPSSPT